MTRPAPAQVRSEHYPGRNLTFAVAGLCLLLLLAWSFWPSNKAQPTLRVGFNDFPPYVQIDAGGGPEGFAVDMVTRAAKLAGVRLIWVPVPPFAEDAFARKQIDLFPLLTVTPERKSRYRLSGPWWENEMVLMSSESARIATAQETAGKRIATRPGAVQKIARALFPHAKVLAINRIEDMLAKFCAGDLDGLFVDQQVLATGLLHGAPPCSRFPLHTSSVPNGSLTLATAATKEKSAIADRLYRKIAELSRDGTLAEVAAHWAVSSPYHNRYFKDVLEQERRSAITRWSLGGAALFLSLLAFQNFRIRRARLVADKARIDAEEAQSRFDAFMKHTPAVTFIRDERGNTVFLNDAYWKLGHSQREQVNGKTAFDLWPEEVALKMEENDRSVLAGEHGQEFIESVPNPQGEMRTFLSLKFPFRNTKGQKFMGAVCLDITDRKRAEEALRFSQFSIERSHDMVLWVNAEERILYGNRAACRKLGYDKEEFTNLPAAAVDALLAPGVAAQRLATLKEAGAATVESVYRTRDGHEFPVEVSLNYLEFDGQEFTCSISRDITERKRAQAELDHQAKYDLLTGLPNRRLFQQRLSLALESGSPVTVFYLDLDGFKLINDTMGHNCGDLLLTQVALRLRACVGETETLARMGGDEFTVIAAGPQTMEAARSLARGILEKFNGSFRLEGRDLMLTASIGISQFPGDAKDTHALLQCADAAMYHAKRLGKNQIQFFTPGMRVAARERLELEGHLHKAIERGEFHLHYQPQFSLPNGEVTRYEALLRWTHPVLGSIPPAKFIPIAEEVGSIVEIGSWVLESACRQAVEWQQTSPGAGVAVNISVVQICHSDFVETVIGVLNRTGLDPRLLDLELTETAVMRSVEHITAKIQLLRRHGVTVSIDDFGSGCNSLAYLQSLTFDTLKIDHSFVQKIGSQQNSVNLTEAVIAMAHHLGMKVVVGGIETEAQLTAMRQIGSDMAQGFLLGMPVAPENQAVNEFATRGM